MIIDFIFCIIKIIIHLLIKITLGLLHIHSIVFKDYCRQNFIELYFWNNDLNFFYY